MHLKVKHRSEVSRLNMKAIIENSNIKTRAWLAEDMPNLIPTSRRQNNRIGQNPVGRASRNSRSQDQIMVQKAHL